MTREIKYENISVELIDWMGNDVRVSNVAKTSFNKWEDESADINTNQVGLLNYLATGLPSSERDDWEKRANASTHWSPFAHCFLSVRCAAPIFLTRQLVKHQIGLSWNEESRRYITDDIALWLPEVVHKKPEKAKQGASSDEHSSPIGIECRDSTVYTTSKGFMNISTERAVRDYYTLLDVGVAPEEARIVLPLNSVTHWVWSGSLMAMMRVVKQRVDSHAQGAAQEFGKKLLAIVEDKFPESVKAFNLSGV
jgi:thymidylate synthase (FAD)